MFPENMTVLKLNSVAHGFSRGSAGTGYNYSTRIRACEMIFKVRGVSMIAWGMSVSARKARPSASCPIPEPTQIIAPKH